MAATQAALIFGLHEARSSQVTWPSTLMAVLSAALLAAGVLRHYWDIYLYRSVRGISFIFVGIDAAGDVFSLASVFFQPKLDIMGAVIYGTELIFWLGVFAAGGYFNLAPWARKNFNKPQFRTVELIATETPSANLDAIDHNVALHVLPSSTSVFRTTSGELANARSRTGFPSNFDVQTSGE